MDQAALRRELVFLRKGPGCTPSKIEQCQQLLAHPWTLDRVVHDDVEPWRAVLDLLDTALRAVPDRRSNALRNAWRLGTEVPGDTLEDRRINFATLRKRSPETIKTWENDVLEDIVLFLSGLEPATRGGAVKTEQPPMRLSERTPHPALQVDAADVRLLVGGDQTLVEIEQRLTVRALRSGVKIFRRGIWSGVRPVAREDILATTGCELMQIEELPGNARQLIFEFPEELVPGRHHIFSFRRRLGEPDEKPYWSYTPQIGTVELMLSVQFQTSPAVVWSFENLYTRAVPGLPDASNILPRDPSNFYVRPFVAMAASESGIAWEW